MRTGIAVPVAALALAIAGATALTTPGPAQGRSSCKAAGAQAASVSKRTMARSILCLLNRKRTSRGLWPLKSHPRQKRAAVNHNKWMLRHKCFAHRCSGELGLVTRLIRANYLPCVCAWGVGENIGWGSGTYSTPRSMVRRWMKSPGHRHNILDPDFRHIGIAVHWGVPVRGDSGGATFTTDFGYKR